MVRFDEFAVAVGVTALCRKDVLHYDDSIVRLTAHVLGAEVVAGYDVAGAAVEEQSIGASIFVPDECVAGEAVADATDRRFDVVRRS